MRCCIFLHVLDVVAFLEQRREKKQQHKFSVMAYEKEHFLDFSIFDSITLRCLCCCWLWFESKVSKCAKLKSKTGFDCTSEHGTSCLKRLLAGSVH